ncbi:hypothetical protein BCh11DRAFT_01727 [Burkholderia sp. Ch1-1]|uniref:Uncharacterized protein n=1 Tax=Paraburkholderia dioscoreae TaxID=2604047 RepID=A0A5Q4YXR6_9BURK|nr:MULTISPECIES: hypothetical protein [Paraburkholderia]EIF33934.1 hypothetical protein BCh11DRAFT_01727 [Burkholderia sp. Ch1-1]MDR8396210.1 hypothetical protein [Paraburkholderia sp. USG1]VVD32842.1 conserved protein of unknown function [Paraburkholderia dioscoreae]
MPLDEHVHSFLAISKAFLTHAGDSLSIDDCREADEPLVMAHVHGEVVDECRDSRR